jgi:hypothetical protein
MTSDNSKDWMDHHYLNFWLWACLGEAEAYLQSARNFDIACQSHRTSQPFDPKRLAAQRFTTKRIMDLNAYRFAMSLGSAVRYLNKLAPLFPTIQPLLEKAEHTRKEGLLLRNMVEHALTNLEAEAKGTPRGGFTRKLSAISIGIGLPGLSPGTADAISTLVDNNGHWLGGRLNVERVISELKPIYEAARVTPFPGMATTPAEFEALS